ncbi:MAG: hypothetical protein HFG14_12390 [Lachnospiraceae bacterium]|jgi:hypothetical protein|nr:hypothetical protein [Lachnospiraceae bacterium]
MIKDRISFIKGARGSILCSFAFSFLLFIYGPLEMYLTNQDDFWLDFYTLFPVSLRAFLIFSAACIALFLGIYVVKIQLYKITLCIFFAAFIASYIQGTFLSNGLPPLDGRDIDWSAYASGYRTSVILWLSICISVMISLKKSGFIRLNRFIILITSLLFLLLGISSILLCITNNGFYRKNIGIATTKNQFEMSTNQNFIILLFDTIDADVFSALLESNPEYREVFRDFTYYDNTMGAYPFTKMSIPFILSGEWYENKTAFNFYQWKAFDHSPLLNELSDRGFKIGIYDQALSLSNPNSRYDNITDIPATVSSDLEFACYISQLSGIKYAPFFLKPLCYEAPEKINALKRPTEEIQYSYFKWANLAFYIEIFDCDTTFTNDNVFKFIHLEGAHLPHRFDKTVRLIENGTYSQDVEACITITSGYLNKLKLSNVYDNSIIIIMSDHGYNGPDSFEGRQHPFFLVKGLNEAHEMNIDHAPISYEDLQKAYTRLLAGNKSDDIFDYKEGDARERRYLLYQYYTESHMDEYLQHGEAGDLTTLLPSGRVFDRH